MNTMHATRRSGGALLMAVITFVMMAGIGAALFSFALAGQRTTMAASTGETAYHVADAGVDDAINKLRAFNDQPKNTTADFASIGRATYDLSGKMVNVVKGDIRSGSYYVTIEPPYAGLGQYKITSVGTVAGESRGIITWIMAQEDSSIFKYGLFGDVYLDAGGNIKTDGYHSGKGTHASQITGVVDGVSVASKTGHIGSNGELSVSGSSMVYGNATPGPGEVVSGGGKIYGTTTPAPTKMTLNDPDFSIPAGTVVQTAITGSRTLAAGSYRVPSVSPSGKSTVTIKGDVRLYVDGDFVFTGQPILKLEPGAKLTVYQNSTSGTAKFQVAGGSLVNSDKNPSSMMFYTNTQIGKLSGNADMYATVYAPDTYMSILGTSGLYGSTIAKTIDIQGTPFFHYDEALAGVKSTKIIVNVKSVEQFIPSK